MLSFSRQLTTLCRVMANQAAPETRLDTLSLTGMALQQTLAEVRILFYLTPAPAVDEPLKLVPCPARCLEPELFISGLPPQENYFSFETANPHWTPLALTDRSFGILFLERRLAAPFNPWECCLISLIAVQTAHHLDHLSRHGPAANTESNHPSFMVDKECNLAWVEGIPLRLSRSETIALHLLAQSPNRVLTRDCLSQALYADESPLPYQREARLDSLVNRLRTKLQRVPHSQIAIETVRGHGYRLRLSE